MAVSVIGLSSSRLCCEMECKRSADRQLGDRVDPWLSGSTLNAAEADAEGRARCSRADPEAESPPPDEWRGVGRNNQRPTRAGLRSWVERASGA